MAFQGFPEEGVQFLRDLRKNNSKTWFDAHRTTYETCCKEPMFDFVRGIGEGLKKIAPRMVADPRINGSVYRINRDIRFSKIKIPYKTNVASIFWPEGGAKHGSAGYYFHLEPEKVVIAGGLYAPEAPALHKIRESIAKNSRKFQKIITAPAFIRAFGALTGQSLKRPPRGFDTDHPAIEFLKMKQYLVYIERKLGRDVHTRRILTKTLELYLTMTPLIRFLNAAIDIRIK